MKKIPMPIHMQLMKEEKNVKHFLNKTRKMHKKPYKLEKIRTKLTFSNLYGFLSYFSNL